jgi:hypothetical protein
MMFNDDLYKGLVVLGVGLGLAFATVILLLVWLFSHLDFTLRWVA